MTTANARRIERKVNEKRIGAADAVHRPDADEQANLCKRIGSRPRASIDRRYCAIAAAAPDSGSPADAADGWRVDQRHGPLTPSERGTRTCALSFRRQAFDLIQSGTRRSSHTSRPADCATDHLGTSFNRLGAMVPYAWGRWRRMTRFALRPGLSCFTGCRARARSGAGENGLRRPAFR